MMLMKNIYSLHTQIKTNKSPNNDRKISFQRTGNVASARPCASHGMRVFEITRQTGTRLKAHNSLGITRKTIKIQQQNCVCFFEKKKRFCGFCML